MSMIPACPNVFPYLCIKQFTPGGLGVIFYICLKCILCKLIVILGAEDLKVICVV